MEVKTQRNNDIYLYKEFLKGNNEAFNEIIKIYRKKLIYFIYQYVNNIDIAEDISQDTFVYILINKTEFEFKYPLKTYIYTIAKCRALNHIKKYKKEEQLDGSVYKLSTDIEIDTDLLSKENKKEIWESMGKLPEKYRTVLYLKYFENFKYKEICTILNKPMPQVKVLLHRAKKMVEKSLKKEEFIC